jgi:hypothetical protein
MEFRRQAGSSSRRLSTRQPFIPQPQPDAYHPRAVLKLDDVGAHVAEDRRGVGAHERGGHVDDPYAGKRSGPSRAACIPRWIIGADRRFLAVEALALHGRYLAAASLRQPGGADIAREDVRIAVDAAEFGGTVFWRVVPGAGRKIDNARHDAVTDGGRREAGTTAVEEAHEIAFGDAAGSRILRIDADDFPSPGFADWL